MHGCVSTQDECVVTNSVDVIINADKMLLSSLQRKHRCSTLVHETSTRWGSRIGWVWGCIGGEWRGVVDGW